MTTPVIITVALTGSVPRKAGNADLCPRYGRRPATPADARRILGLAA